MGLLGWLVHIVTLGFLAYRSAYFQNFPREYALDTLAVAW